MKFGRGTFKELGLVAMAWLMAVTIPVQAQSDSPLLLDLDNSTTVVTPAAPAHAFATVPAPPGRNSHVNYLDLSSATVVSSQPANPAPTPAPVETPPPSPAPIARPDTQTAATFCPACNHASLPVRHQLEKLPIGHVAGLEDRLGPYHSAAEKCFSQELLRVAKRFAPHRDHSRGKCARGVRDFLNRSGIYGDWSNGLGDAISYHAYGKLKALGFHNYINEFPTPYNAPAGAVLVFAGPDTGSYLRTGRYGHPPGDWLGHVTVKGDDGLYYTDGRTREPALGWPRSHTYRRLVGVYLMDHCTDSCSQRLRNMCGG